MTTLPAVTDAEDAAGLLRELFRNPPPAARELATADDAAPEQAVLRWLLVTLPVLPPQQAELLRAGAGRLLAEPALAGYVLCLLDEGGEVAVDSAVAVVADGEMRGISATPAGGADLHALLVGLCARLGAVPPVAAIERDLADPRYRDLALLLAVLAPPALLPRALTIVAGAVDPDDEYGVEALGRALREALQRHGEETVVTATREATPTPALLAALREAVEPARLAWLSDTQRAEELAAIRRQAEERPDDAYLRLRLDAAAREVFLRRAERALGTAS